MNAFERRTVSLFEAKGFHVGTSSWWNRHANRQHDFFNAFDLIGCHREHGFLGIQATSHRNMRARLRKIIRREKRQRRMRYLEMNRDAYEWVLHPAGSIVIVGWDRTFVKPRLRYVDRQDFEKWARENDTSIVMPDAEIWSLHL